MGERSERQTTERSQVNAQINWELLTEEERSNLVLDHPRLMVPPLLKDAMKGLRKGRIRAETLIPQGQDTEETGSA